MCTQQIEQIAKKIFYGDCKHVDTNEMDAFEPYGAEEEHLYRCTICGLGISDEQPEDTNQDLAEVMGRI
jgi:hypothetical protein